MGNITFDVIAGEYHGLVPCYSYAQKIDEGEWKYSNVSFVSVKKMAKAINNILTKKGYEGCLIRSNFLTPEYKEWESIFTRGEGIHLNSYTKEILEIRPLKRKEKSKLIKKLFKLLHEQSSE